MRTGSGTNVAAQKGRPLCAGEQGQTDDAADGEYNTSGDERSQNPLRSGGLGNRIAGESGRVFVLDQCAGRVVGLE